MKKDKLADVIGMVDDQYIIEAEPKTYRINKWKKCDKRLFSIAVAAAILAATVVSACAISFAAKEKNRFQIANDNGMDLSCVDGGGDLLYTKADKVNDGKENSNPEEPEEFACTDPKVNIYNKMLNSIDYFNRVTLIMETSMLYDVPVTVEYQVDIDAGTSYQSVSADNTIICEAYSASENMIYVDCSAQTYIQKYLPTYCRADTPYIPLKERIITMEDGFPCYSYRRNVTNCMYASYCLVPQEITFSYLKDFDKWEIADEDWLYLDRSCIKIAGKPSGYIAEKHGIDSFTMVVDAETGVLMEFTGARNEKVSRYMIAKACAFESDGEIKQFSAEEYSDYTEIQTLHN